MKDHNFDRNQRHFGYSEMTDQQTNKNNRHIPKWRIKHTIEQRNSNYCEISWKNGIHFFEIYTFPS